MSQEVSAVDMWQGFNPASLGVGLAYVAIAIAVMSGHKLQPTGTEIDDHDDKNRRSRRRFDRCLNHM